MNGFLATDETTWVNRLSALIEDRGLRDRMGQAGRAVVERDYSVQVQAPRLLELLHTVSRAGRGQA